MIEPRDVVRAWVEAFDAADPDALAPCCSETAVNRWDIKDPVEGREAIRAMFATAFAVAPMCISEALFQDGAWAILEWRDPLGLRGPLPWN